MLARLGLILLTLGDRYDYNAKAAEREAGRAELSWLYVREGLIILEGRMGLEFLESLIEGILKFKEGRIGGNL